MAKGSALFDFALGASVFFLLGGVYLAEKTEHVGGGEMFICAGVAWLALAIAFANRPTKK